MASNLLTLGGVFLAGGVWTFICILVGMALERSAGEVDDAE